MRFIELVGESETIVVDRIYETTNRQLKIYEDQAKSFNENIFKMQQTNNELQKFLSMNTELIFILQDGVRKRSSCYSCGLFA